MKRNTDRYGWFTRSYRLVALLFGICVGSPLAMAHLPDGSLLALQGNDLVYISNDNGTDVILQQHQGSDQVLYRCKNNAEMVLTPSIGLWDHSITFLIDGGSINRSIHHLNLDLLENGRLKTDHEELATFPGASWPVKIHDGGIVFIMPDESTLSSGKVTGLFKLREGSIETIHSAEQRYKYFWPLVSPVGDRLFYRQSAVPQEGVEPGFWSRMILRDLESGETTYHFVDEPIYLEQWVSEGIIYSVKLGDQARTRVYYLFDPIGQTTRELYRGSVWQARFSDDLSKLAVLRTQPENPSFFDIYLVDPHSGSEHNMSNTPQVSESLVGWLPMAP